MPSQLQLDLHLSVGGDAGAIGSCQGGTQSWIQAGVGGHSGWWQDADLRAGVDHQGERAVAHMQKARQWLLA